MTKAWYLRMWNPATEQDFSVEAERRRVVGVLMGNWDLEQVLEGGHVVLDKLRALPTPKRRGVNPGPGERLMHKAGLRAVETFFGLRDPGIEDGDFVAFPLRQPHRKGQRRPRITGVVVGRAGPPVATPGFTVDASWDGTHPFPEPVKCRQLVDPVTYRFDDPAVPPYVRVLTMTGQGTLQRIRGCETMVRAMHEARDAANLQRHVASLPARKFLEFLPPATWEAICLEYLRSKHGLRLLGLSPGGTMEDWDLIGITSDGRRLYAQCKNKPEPLGRAAVQRALAPGVPEGAVKLLMALGGTKQEMPDVVSGDDVAAWLENEPNYLAALRGQ